MSADQPVAPPGPKSFCEPVDVVAVISADLTVIGWTEAGRCLWGYQGAEVLHRPARRLLAAPAGSGPLGLLTSGHPWSGRVEIRCRDGHTALTEFRAVPLNPARKEENLFVWSAGPASPSALTSPDPSVLKALMERSPIGIVVWDRDLRCTWFNNGDEREGPFRFGPEIGHHVAELLATDNPKFLQAVMHSVLERGVPVLDHELWKSATAEKEARAYSISIFRLDDADGEAVGVCTLAVDVTRSRARGRLNMLSNAGTRIGTTLDVIKTAQELADASVPGIADYVTVDLAEVVPLGEEPLERLGSTDASIPVFRRAGAASIHPDFRESLAEIGTPVFVPPSSPFTTVLHSRKSYFEPRLDTSPGTWLDNDPNRARVIRQTRMHTLMIVPLHARGTMLGIAVFVRTENPSPFTRGDLLLAEGLADRASLSLDNARRYSRERAAALTLQRELLPDQLWGGSAVEVASRYLPADTHGGVGGDWFDVIPLTANRVALVVGDVVGHGLNAAATMGRLRTVVRTLADRALSPPEVLAGLDRIVVDMTKDHPDDTGFTSPVMGATCLYAVYDPATRRCTIASAGHPPPAIVSPDGDVAFADVPAGAPIGLGLGNYESLETELAEGSLIALYTDGLIERRGIDIDQGLERLRCALALPAPDLDGLCSAVIETIAARMPSDDDIALLLARTLAVSGPA
ncbi:SpoIIE family protein phosphatase [Streptomyces sp. NBC_01724]|uniref:SpoIIE family protein phosphatase n=1 Tax=unclassified Streptomyces TaxID=2593676 RepID=UPI002E30A3B1|nr:SpoIIE family protein phosphatase [Streptomyces sp. NBC_01724]WTE64580.1 SpoIIE family protein phosphatase [Streptomyces sp. NBC_01617]WTI91868.1 SpoIIE family protein phosphatase [Streptomyces sp. NBC_00724]